MQSLTNIGAPLGNSPREMVLSDIFIFRLCLILFSVLWYGLAYCFSHLVR